MTQTQLQPTLGNCPSSQKAAPLHWADRSLTANKQAQNWNLTTAAAVLSVQPGPNIQLAYTAKTCAVMMTGRGNMIPTSSCTSPGPSHPSSHSMCKHCVHSCECNMPAWRTVNKLAWSLTAVVVQVDGSSGGAVQPARHQLQGHLGLPQLICPAAQAHVGCGGLCLHSHILSALLHRLTSDVVACACTATYCQLCCTGSRRMWWPVSAQPHTISSAAQTHIRCGSLCLHSHILSALLHRLTSDVVACVCTATYFQPAASAIVPFQPEAAAAAHTLARTGLNA